MSQNILEGPKMYEKMPQEQRIRQKGQHVTGNDTKIDPEVA